MKKKIICWPSTIYALLLYLVHAKDEEIDTTYYIFRKSGALEKFAKRVKRGYVNAIPRFLTSKWWIDWIIVRFHYWLHLPLLRNKDVVYMQDHAGESLVYVYNHRYTLIEDSAKHIYYMFDSGQSAYGREILKNLERTRNNVLGLKKRLYNLLYTPLSLFPYGINDKAYRVLLSVDDPSIYLKGKQKIILPLLNEKLWNSFSDFKRQRILDIYDLNEEDIKNLKTAKCLLLTQPFSFDNILTNAEHKDLYEKILSHYNYNVLIKVHPRDDFDYASAFPEVPVFKKPIPAELLCMIGLNPQCVIGITSNAVNQFDSEIHWLGSEVCPKIYDAIGHVPAPQSAHLVQLN